MQEKQSKVIINEIEAEPLSEYVIDFLKQRNSEAPFIDFKLKIDISKDSNFPEIAKDIFAFSNYGGGWLLIGWQEEKNNRFIPVGLPQDYNVDSASLQEKFNSFVDEPIEILYKEMTEINKEGKEVRFAYIYISPSNKILKPIKDGKYKRGEKDRVVFRIGDIFYRRGTQSIVPSPQELQIMKKRIEKENYKLSLLSGNPDEIEEVLYSNLFEVIEIPEYLYLGTKRKEFDDDVSIKSFLKEKKVFPEWHYKFKEWEDKIITFENIEDSNNIYSGLIENTTVSKENISSWLDNKDKSKLVIELLDRELKHYAISKGIFYNKERKKLFYATEYEKREQKWKSKYKQATRLVASQMYASQLDRYIYCHPAFYANFIKLGNNIFLKILPTFILTEDGKKVISGSEEGTIITKLSYDRYNNNYMNTISFWVKQLTSDDLISINNYIKISSKPVQSKLPYGILFDIPSSNFKLNIDDSTHEEAIIEDE